MIIITVTTYLLFVLFHLTLTQDENSYEVRELSLTRPYHSVFSTSNSHWDLTGNTLVTDKFLRLTSDSQSRAGGLWNNVPIVYADWEIHVNFKIHGQSKGFYGDGIVIWYVKEPKLIGPVFGYRDHFTGLGIFLDTYANKPDQRTHNYPYISAIVNNGSLHYDHDNDGVDLNLAGCEATIRARAVDTSVAIRYQNDRLTVSTDVNGENTWAECFAIDNIQLPTHYYLGFSAATGDLTDNHDIITVHTFELESSEQRKNQDRKSIIPSGPTFKIEEIVVTTPQSSGWSALKIFLVVVGVLILLLGLIAIYYYKQNRRRGPRFY